MGAPGETLSPPDYRRHLKREPADRHFRKVSAGRPAIEGDSPEPRALPETPGRFEIYRADEIRTSSVLFAGGDWRWRLADAAGRTLVEAGGYRSEDACRKAVTMLRRHVPLALFSEKGSRPHDTERRPEMDTDDASRLVEEQDLATTEERKVLALERIADHLQKITRGLALGDGRGGDVAPDMTTTTRGDGRAGDRWENEGGHAGPESYEASEVKRTLVEHFAVGGYNYTNLAHAIVEAKRARQQDEQR